MKYSIVIPVGPGRNVEILQAIKKQKFDKKKYEIIIIKGTNVPENRNRGYAKSHGRWIISLDDDGYIKEDYLQQVDSFIKKHPDVSVFGGPQLTPDNTCDKTCIEQDGPFAVASGKALGTPVVCPGIYKRYIKCKETTNADSSYLSGANLIIKREVLKKISFDTTQYPADDVLFVKKAMKEGFKVGYSPDVCIYHKRRPNAKGLFKQIYDYGKAGAELPEGREKGFIPSLLFSIPAFFTLYILLFAWGFIAINYALNGEDNLFIIWCLPLLIYLGIGVILSIKNFTWRFLPIMFIIHFAYGLGILGVWCSICIDKFRNCLLILCFCLLLLFLWPWWIYTLKKEAAYWNDADRSWR